MGGSGHMTYHVVWPLEGMPVAVRHHDFPLELQCAPATTRQEPHCVGVTDPTHCRRRETPNTELVALSNSHQTEPRKHFRCLRSFNTVDITIILLLRKSKPLSPCRRDSSSPRRTSRRRSLSSCRKLRLSPRCVATRPNKFRASAYRDLCYRAISKQPLRNSQPSRSRPVR